MTPLVESVTLVGISIIAKAGEKLGSFIIQRLWAQDRICAVRRVAEVEISC